MVQNHESKNLRLLSYSFGTFGGGSVKGHIAASAFHESLFGEEGTAGAEQKRKAIKTQYLSVRS